MADFFTVSELIEKIQDEMDLQEESFFDTQDFYHAINDAIDECEQEILQLYEGYFNTSTTISLVNGTSAYSLPSNIYASKVKLVQFIRNANDFYKVERIKLRDIAAVQSVGYSQNAQLFYDIQYPSSAIGQQIVFYPTPGESITDGIRLCYIRNAERVSALTDTIDIPDGHPFIMAFVRNRIAMKELSPLAQSYAASLDQQREQLRQSFSQMVPDEDQEIERDTSFYSDFDSGYGEI